MALLRLALAALLLLSPSQTVLPHSGGTNSEGCHTDHRTGDYHCHRAKTPAVGSTTYCHVVDGQRHCGYSRTTCSDLAATYGGYCQRE